MLLSHSTVGNVILRHRRKTDRRTSVPPHLPFLFAGNSVATGGFPGTRLLHKARPGCAGVSGPQPPCRSGPAGALWQQQTQKHGTLGTARGRRAQHAAMETKRNQASSRAAWLTKLTPPVCHNPNLRRSALPESVRWLTTSWGPQGTGDGKVWKKRQWGGPGGGEPARWGLGWGCRGRWRHRVLHGGTSRSPAIISSVQSLSRVRLCDTMDCSTPGLPVHHQLPEFTQTHVHCVGDAIQPSHPPSSPSPPAFNLSQHQGLFQGVSSSHQVAKVLEFQLQHQSFQ